MRFAAELGDPLREKMEKFRASISKQKDFYAKLSGHVRKEFSEV